LKQVLEGQLADADLSFAIPSFALGGLMQGLPADLGLTIDVSYIGYDRATPS